MVKVKLKITLEEVWIWQFFKRYETWNWNVLSL